MRVGVIVDSSCDLPKSYFEHHNIQIIPMTIIGGDKPFFDYRDKEQTDKFGIMVKKHKGTYDSQPPTKEEIEYYFLTKAIYEYEYVLFVTASSYRSKTYDNANAAIAKVLPKYRHLREKAGLSGNFQVRVIDSQSLLAGQGVVVSEIINCLYSGTNGLEVTEKALQIANHTQAYLVPHDLYYLYEKAQKKGDNSVTTLQYLIGSNLHIYPIIMCHQGHTKAACKVQGFKTAVQKLFNFVADEIPKGLLSSSICISYAGNRAKIKTLPGFAYLEKMAKDNGVTLLVSKMSMTAVANVGPDSICVAFATDNPTDIKKSG